MNLCRAWYAKLDEARTRAKFSFSKTDEGMIDFDSLLNEAEASISKGDKRCEEAARAATEAQEKERNRIWKREDADRAREERKEKFLARMTFFQSDMGHGAILGIFLLLSIIGLCVSAFSQSNAPKKETKRLEKLLSEIQTSIDAENYEIAELKILDLTWNVGDSSNGGKEKNAVYIEFWNKKQQLLKEQIEKGKESKK